MGRIIQNRVVDNPMLTDGLKYAPPAATKPRKGSVVFTTERPKQQLTRITVEENAMTRIGALCFIRRRQAHHEAAAERFKSMYEAFYGIGNPAMDPSRVQVDTSPIAHDSGMAGRIDNARKLNDLERSHGHLFNRLVALLVLCVPAGEGQTSRPRQRSVDQALADLDHLAELWGAKQRAA